MFKILEKPYPLTESTAARWRMCIGFSVFVFLFLYGFQPFGLDETHINLPALTAGYALVCFVLMVVLNILLVPLLPGLFRENSWTTGRQIFWTLVNIACIGLGNAIFTQLAFEHAVQFHDLIRFEIYTLSIGLFPVAASAVLNQIRLERRYRLASEQLNQSLHPEKSINAKDDIVITLSSDTQGEFLQLAAEQLMYVQAADNYAEAVYSEAGQVQKMLLRTTLKRVEAELAGHSQFWRCHKSFLVNKQLVVHTSGNAQGYKLHLLETGMAIPVSRSKHDELEAQF
jgi:DNA-binding LytR/AlgR family response regulator